MFSNDEKIIFLKDLIQIPSENNYETRVAEYIAEFLAQYGIESELVEYKPGRSNLVAEIKGDQPGKVLVYSGHLDVVDAGSHSDWTYPPFEGEIHDGKMYGRGTSDMKAGVAAMVLAFVKIKESGVSFKGTLRLALTVGEEVGMYGSRQLVDEGYVSDADAFVIGEPSGADSIIYAHKGSLQYEIIAKGQAAHSSMPELGMNALQLMVDYINLSNQVFAEYFSTVEDQALGRTLNVNTVIKGGDQINTVPDCVVMQANARTIPQLDNARVIEIIEDVIGEINERGQGKLVLNVLQDSPAVSSNSNSDLIQSIRAATGRDIPATVIQGATDASNFGRIDKEFDLAIYGPGNVEVVHSLDEYVEVDEYLQFIEDYEKIALDYLNK